MKQLTSLSALVLVCGLASAAEAQTFDDVRIDIQAMVIRTSGGERPNTGSSTGPIVIGETHSAVFSQMPQFCGGFGVSGGSQLASGAAGGWIVQVTPTKVENHAATFHLHWVRARDNNKESASPGGDTDLTLKPGESLPIDFMSIAAPARWPSGTPCDAKAVSLRVSVDYWPREQDDRRLAATDLWLVEKLPDGTERSQPLSVRGLFNRPIPFYFDTLTDGAVALDIFGEVTASPQRGSIEVKLETRSRLTQGSESSVVWRDGRFMSSRKIDSVLTVKPNDVISVELPRLSENDSGAFASRPLSIRIRTRQIR
jgi:hypothetical protein